MKQLSLIIIIATTGFIMFNIFSKTTEVNVSIDHFKEMIEKERGIVIDVRTKQEYNAGHLKITDAQYDFLNGEFQDQIENFDKNKTYYLYCRTGNRSGQAARIMQNEGFKNVFNVGGFEELAEAGFDANMSE
ncbi:MAG: rhodanese-like domain-containing protein [Balneolaceae bacterium]|nr:MAG: rhodanese-like domain-containing protein [Balneolaceae bacterium]